MPGYPVSAHAVIRYLERIDPFDMKGLRKVLDGDAGNHEIASAAAIALGVTMRDLQERVLPPSILHSVGGLALVRKLKLPGHECVVADGIVVTVVPKTKRQKLYSATRREAHKRSQGVARKKRGRP